MSAPMLERRRIEAEILALVFEEMKAGMDEEAAKQIIARAVKKSAVAQGKMLAEQDGGKTSLAGFLAYQPLWTAGGTLEIEPGSQDDEHFEFKVTRCKYAEMYKDMGVGDLGFIFSCNRDGTMCEGYDENLKLTRTRTIMEGADHCDFRFNWEDGESSKD